MFLATMHDSETPTAATSAAVRVGGGWRPLPAADLSELMAHEDWQQKVRRATVDDSLQPDDVPEQRVLFGLPLPRPSKVICCGLNYEEHIVEMKREIPQFPTLFAKFADTLAAPYAPLLVHENARLDWEAELAVVIGRTLSRADEDESAAAIAGYTVANDISMRDWQGRTTQWLQGKAFDRTTPIGPVIATPDEVDPVEGLRVECFVNGTRTQSGTTRTLVFSAARLLSYISSFTTLQPGDVVLTGTPGGVGSGMRPPRYLADGDVIETSIEGIGHLRNTISFTA